MCRCLVVCPSLGIFATAHADGSLNLRLLPSRSPADRVSPPTDQTPAAQIKVVLAVGSMAICVEGSHVAHLCHIISYELSSALDISLLFALRRFRVAIWWSP